MSNTKRDEMSKVRQIINERIAKYNSEHGVFEQVAVSNIVDDIRSQVNEPRVEARAEKPMISIPSVPTMINKLVKPQPKPVPAVSQASQASVSFNTPTMISKLLKR